MSAKTSTPLVAVVMGSHSDAPTMQHACDVLAALSIAFEWRVLSAHRMPDEMFRFAEDAHARGLRVIIAGALMFAVGTALTPFASSEWALLLTLGIVSAAGAGAGRSQFTL